MYKDTRKTKKMVSRINNGKQLILNVFNDILYFPVTRNTVANNTFRFFGFYKKKIRGLDKKKNPEPLIFLTLKPSYFVPTYTMVGGQSPSETEKNGGVF